MERYVGAETPWMRRAGKNHFQSIGPRKRYMLQIGVGRLVSNSEGCAVL